METSIVLIALLGCLFSLGAAVAASNEAKHDAAMVLDPDELPKSISLESVTLLKAIRSRVTARATTSPRKRTADEVLREIEHDLEEIEKQVRRRA